MKRRDFLKKGTMVAGLASSSTLVLPAIAEETAKQKPSEGSRPAGAASEEIRSSEYLRRARADESLPKAPVQVESHGLDGVRISPMPLEERLRRGIVPRRGFCSIAPAADALLIAGNGPINIDMTCDPYSEQITFHHESIFVPHKHFEAPNIAGVFPQVRQMMLEGKYHEAAKLAYDEWHKSSLPQGGGYRRRPGIRDAPGLSEDRVG